MTGHLCPSAECAANGHRMRPETMMQPVTFNDTPEPPLPPPSRSPDAADLALAKVAVPWIGRHRIGIGGNRKLAEALAAWLTARGIY